MSWWAADGFSSEHTLERWGRQMDDDRCRRGIAHFFWACNMDTHLSHIFSTSTIHLAWTWCICDLTWTNYATQWCFIATKTWKRAQTRGNILVKLRPWESHDCGKREWSRNLFTMSLWQLLVWEFRGNTFQSARLSSFSRLTWLLGGTPEAQTLKSVALLSHGQKLRCFRPFQPFLGEIWNLWWLIIDDIQTKHFETSEHIFLTIL